MMQLIEPELGFKESIRMLDDLVEIINSEK